MIDTILIVEDEKPNADRLRRLIKAIRPKAEIVAVLESITETVEWLGQHPQPDLVMIDVRLSDGLSFEIFEKVRIECPVIFTTAYDEYAVRAFKYNSIDYLLKPVEQDELENAFTEAEKLTRRVDFRSLEGLLNFVQPKEFRSRFLLPFKDGYKTVLVSDVIYFHSEFKITRACLTDGSEEVLVQTMEELEQQLNPKAFFRANRQFIIHIDAISRIHHHFNGKLKIDIRDHPELEVLVSREKANVLKAWLDY
ncbi:MAG TPA: LytTR family DNA-binding domain-containing protein [Dyadobacter sp.]|nr:LytTR family DNA-binding domain-containing protein [Dyadobacter sp.]